MTLHIKSRRMEKETASQKVNLGQTAGERDREKT